MDRRQQKTRKAILNAFEELISKKKYEQITVQDIIDEANIGRTTFYAHFETKDGVLDAICVDLFQHIFEEEPQEEPDHDFSQSDNTVKEKMIHILYHLKENQIRYKRLFKSESAELFWEFFRKWFTKELSQDIEQQMARKKLKVPEGYYMDFYVSTFIETVKWWFKEECKTKPEIVENYFEQVS